MGEQDRAARRALMALAAWECQRCGASLDTARGRWICAQCGTPHCPWCGMRASRRCRHLLAWVDPKGVVRTGRLNLRPSDAQSTDRPALIAGWSVEQLRQELGEFAPLAEVHVGDPRDLPTSPGVLEQFCRWAPDLIDAVVPDAFYNDERRILRTAAPAARAFFALDPPPAVEHLRAAYTRLAEGLARLSALPPESAPLVERIIEADGDVAISTNGRTVSVTNWRGEAVIVDRDADRTIWPAALPNSGRPVALSPDGRRALIAGPGRRAAMLDLESGAALWRRAAPSAVHQPAFDRAWTRAAFRSGEGVAVIALEDGRTLVRPAGPHDPMMPVAVAQIDNERVMLRAPVSFRLMPSDPVAPAGPGPLSVARPVLSPDGGELCTVATVTTPEGVGAVIGWWEAATGLLQEMEIGQTGGAAYALNPAVAYAPGGSVLATASGPFASERGTGQLVTLWDALVRRPLAYLGHDAPVRRFAFSPDGNWIATVSEHFVKPAVADFLEPTTDAVIRLWDVEGLERRRWVAPTSVEWLGVAANGTVIAAQSGGGVCILPASGEVPSLVPHRRRLPLALSGDGRVMVTVVMRTATALDACTGDVIARFDHPHIVREAAISADGRVVLTSCHDGRARVWRVPAG